MGPLMYNDYRQQPITSDEACAHYRAYLARLEGLIADQGASCSGCVHCAMRLSSLAPGPPTGGY